MPRVLVDVEHRMQLPSTCRPSVWVRVYRDGEATFTVDETYDPLRIELEPRLRGFLLIVPTRRIVTGHSWNPTKRV